MFVDKTEENKRKMLMPYKKEYTVGGVWFPK